MTESDYQQQVDARSRELLAACHERGTYRSLWGFHAAMANDGDAWELIELTARHHEPGPFNIIPGMCLLGRWGDRIPEEAEANIKRMFVEAPQQRGNTENHWLMYYAGNLLAAERWADEPLWWNGLPPAAMHAEASRWILGMIARTATIGHYEYDSTGYHNEHFVPYLALAEYARDEKVREQSRKMALLLLADMALEYFHGAYAGGHSREGNVNTWTQVGPGQGLNYLYFGDETFDPERHCQGYAIPAMAAQFRPPALLARMALDRFTPHSVRKTKPPRATYRHLDEEPGVVRKYTWMSRSFALGSTQTGLTAPAAPIDLVSWDLTWQGERHQATIVCAHPYRSAARLSAFLPELPQRVGRTVGTSKPFLQVPDRLFGASPYERMMQYEGTIIVQYQIPADDDTPYVNCFLPKGPAWHEQDGWILGDLGGFYVGLHIVGTYRWEDVHDPGKDGNWIDGWLLRIDDTRAAVILEAVEADTVGSFTEFCEKRCDPARLDVSAWPGAGRIAVDSVQGDRLEMTYDGAHMVDGTSIDYDGYPLFDGPGVEAPCGTGKLSFSHDGEQLDLDFGVDPEAPVLPMRVIG